MKEKFENFGQLVFVGAAFYVVWAVLFFPCNFVFGTLFCLFDLGAIAWHIITVVSFFVLVVRPTIRCIKTQTSSKQTILNWIEKVSNFMPSHKA